MYQQMTLSPKLGVVGISTMAFQTPIANTDVYKGSFFPQRERGGSVVECRTPEREVRGSRPSPCCVLEQDTLLPESTG